ncbi:MAG: 4-hydroxy-tetrahydrodipicolinate reductase [Candidatus Omnitrophica bacterium]|nr:4-hydroxy-tetrahydrodipicolinate reductase [Candidatus Omnitrophota bacterium]
MIKLAISGCQGRMGQLISDLASKNKNFEIFALIESPLCKDVPESSYGVKISKDINAVKGADVLIDFTLPEPTMKSLEACLKHNVRMVIGTTGLSDDERLAIQKASQKIAIVQSTNMSVGVNVVFGLLKTMAASLKGYDVAITETHHIHKKDAPSGTAKTMAEVIGEVRGKKVTDISSVREGEVVGYHKVTFDSPVDTIEISHNAKNRGMFAEGAIIAAGFLAKKKNGFYNMQQVLGLV